MLNEGDISEETLTAPASPGGAWTEAVLHNFSGPYGDGATPEAGVVIGPGGVLYGTTLNGGTVAGTLFSLTPPGSPDGAWTETILHNFTGTPNDGATFVLRLAGQITPGGTVTTLYSFRLARQLSELHGRRPPYHGTRLGRRWGLLRDNDSWRGRHGWHNFQNHAERQSDDATPVLFHKILPRLRVALSSAEDAAIFNVVLFVRVMVGII